ncbi:prepilin-type N-terminal cleavage/methylation domain-containing protein [Phormidium sp. FACHB-592]|uniref:Prepilin-type N-terminal cleavage/methylation domain-containing protein n=1 Tax=Stenomitos frigidus AS-A4 TaxID=2933935 RepID=A0ABV0KH66_9CYAN|nr:prepilin-type N-terminal cleavage/methylation domain-containing protein [Phormidium sp. FACHB-592]MBD2073843.1 prepilin-type N-terminal cleavage/methylation domain-containing protein [Phormidium sp. FACHB-592]
MKIKPHYRTALAKQFSQPPAAGFSLLEMIVAIVVSSTLFAIMAPSWAELVKLQRLNAAQERVLQVMYDAQNRAKHKRIAMQASFRNPDGVIQWAIHPASVAPTAALWSRLDANVKMDDETTLQQSGGVRRVQFDHDGTVNGSLGRLTLSAISGGKAKRCVIVSTLLGKLRTGTEHPTQKDDKFCY